MKVVLPDNSELELPEGATGLDAARAIGPKLAEQAVLVRANGQAQDLRLPLHDGQPIQILTTRDRDDPDALYVLRHSSAHLLAEAVRRLYPGVKVAIGPPIENGFYYDFEFPEPISEDDLPRIEEEIRRELEEGRDWTREEVTAEEARKRGAEVTLLAANLGVPAPPGVEVVEAPTARAMLEQALAHSDADLVLMAAAVADYRPVDVTGEKRPKDDDAWEVTLEPTTDVLRTLGEQRTNGQVLIGFAADRGERGLARAREKLDRKRVDLVVYNDVSREDIGFDAEDNEVVLIGTDGERRVGKASKDRIAAAIVDTAEELLRERGR